MHQTYRWPAALGAALAVLTTYGSLSEALGRDATIRLPEALAAQSTRIEFAGFGGYNKGEYTGAEYHGEFTRSESRLGVFDPLYVANRGKSSFTLVDTAGTTLLSASCEMRRNTATVRVVTLDLDKLAYDCSLTGDQSSTRLVLGEPKREGFKERLLARERRRGEAIVFDHHFVIESVHEYAGSKLRSQTPLGYVIESDGAVAAAVDLLDWSPIVHLSDKLDASQQQAAIAVALALAVLRDPANSALED